MIYVNLKDRIGNNLFQIAAAYSLAKQLGVPFRARITDCWTPDDKSLSDYLAPFRENLLRNVEFVSEIPADCEAYHESCFHYQPLPEKDNLVLNGFFQSEKYFNEQAIRELFCMDADTEAYIQTKYRSLLDKHPVCIQVRRGNYLILEHFYTICPSSYYRRAMQRFPDNTCFLVASDDIAWCKTQFRGEKFFFIDGETITVSLYLQSMCSHYITCNSTFSWWAAWLNPDPAKTVIYPMPWFGYQYRNKLKAVDLPPTSWTGLSVYPSPLRMQINDWMVCVKYYDRQNLSIIHKTSRVLKWLKALLKKQTK